MTYELHSLSVCRNLHLYPYCHHCRVEFLPEEMTFFRTGGRKWKKLISSISSAEDLEESGRFGKKWNKWNITNI